MEEENLNPDILKNKSNNLINFFSICLIKSLNLSGEEKKRDSNKKKYKNLKIKVCICQEKPNENTFQHSQIKVLPHSITPSSIELIIILFQLNYTLNKELPHKYSNTEDLRPKFPIEVSKLKQKTSNRLKL